MKITIENAIQLLNQGQVIGLPTETVYGLAAWSNREDAIEKIFQLKGRPQSNPLILHISTQEQLFKYAHSISRQIIALIEHFWPGPLTIIVPANEKETSPILRAHLPTIAVRMSSHPIMQKVVQEISPIVAPSANISGKPSSTTYQHVEKDFGKNFPILDGGPCLNGIESTIVIEKGGKIHIARLGAISQEILAEKLGYFPEIILEKSTANPICPGQQFLHYSPNAKLYLCQSFNIQQNCTIIGFSDRTYPTGNNILYFGSTDKPESVAYNLYHILRTLDTLGIEAAYVDINIPTIGIWKTIHERLYRASQK